MLVDLVNEVQIATLIAPQAVTVVGTITTSITAVTTFVDFSDCEISTGAILATGNVTGTSPSYGVQVEESNGTADGWTWTAIPGLQFVSVTTSNQTIVQRGLRSKQFIRANVSTSTGTTPNESMCLTAIAARKYVAASGSQGGYSRSPST